MFQNFMKVWLLVFVSMLLTGCGQTQKDMDHSKQAAKEALNYDSSSWPASFGFGRPANDKEIAAIDIDIMPDGRGLPEGEGDAVTGGMIYVVKCAACHGKTGRE